MALWWDLLVYHLVFFISLFFLLYKLFTKYFNYWKDRNVPHDKPVLLFGTNKELLVGKLNMGEMSLKHYRAWPKEKLVGCYQSRWPEVIIRDPDLIKNVLVKDFPNFHFREKPFDDELEPLLKNLFHMNNERWKVLRNKLSPLFSSGKLKNMFHLMVERSEEFHSLLCSIVNEKQIVDIRELSAKYTTDVIGSCAFGIQTNSMKDEKAPFRQIGAVIFDTGIYKTIRMMLRVTFPGLANLLKVRMFKEEVHAFMSKLIGDILDQRKGGSSGRRDFIDLLIELRNSGQIKGNAAGKKIDDELVEMEITDDIVVAQAFAFFAAGFETSSTAMSFTLYELAVNPEVQEKAYQEVISVLENYDGKVTYEGIHEMKYLDKVLSEALRKYPPLPVLTRECTSPYVFPGTDVQINTNCTVVIPILALHRDPQYWPDPDKFDPERFSSEAIANRHQFVYLPFGDGPRICPGARFGKVQSMVGLTTILKKFRVEACARTPEKIIPEPSSYVIQHKDKIWLKLKER